MIEPLLVGFDDNRPPLLSGDRPAIDLPTDFIFHRPPLYHQLRDFLRFRAEPYHALFYEQRARKTKVELDIFRWRYELGPTSPLYVDMLLVIAFPAGVHRVWIDELEKDFPPDFLAKCRHIAWTSGKTTAGRNREEAITIRDHRGPIVVTMNCEATITQKGWKYIEWLLRTRRTHAVADECSFAGNWSARTRKLEALGCRPNVIVKAILDGTPCEENPAELYHPCNFLSPGLLGYDTKAAFKGRYFEFEEEEVPDGRGGIIRQRVKKQRHGPGGKVLSEYEVFKGYRNLDELFDKMLGPNGFASRVRRADVSDAPAKTYQSRPFELGDLQRKVYDDLRDKYVAEIAGGEVRAANVLLRMTRLQMVARNYYPPEPTSDPCQSCHGYGLTADETEECPTCDGLGVVIGRTQLRRIGNRNPAMDAFVQEITASRSPFVVWAHFRQDVADCVVAARAAGKHVFQFDGGIPSAERERSYQAFKRGEGDGIIATELSGLQRGRDLTRAYLTIYYSNCWSLRARRQSEDRTEGLDRNQATEVVDLIANDTRDIDVINALREKRNIASLIMGDPITKWL